MKIHGTGELCDGGLRGQERLLCADCGTEFIASQGPRSSAARVNRMNNEVQRCTGGACATAHHANAAPRAVSGLGDLRTGGLRTGL